MNNQKRSKRLIFQSILFLSLLLLPLQISASAQEKTTQDQAEWTLVEQQWYIMEINSIRAGWMHAIVETDGKRFRSSNKSVMTISRMNDQITVESETMFLETVDGQPIEMRSIGHTGLQPVHTVWRFEDDHVMHITKQGGRESTKRKPRPEGEWLTPMAADRLLEEKRAAGVKEITYRVLTPENGLTPMDFSTTLTGRGEYEWNGKAHPVTIWTTVTNMLPVPVTEKLDAEGVLLEGSFDIGIGLMVQHIANEADAKRPVGRKSPEVFSTTFITPSRPIRRPMRATTARFRLHLEKGDMPELPSAGAQRVEESADDNSAMLVVNLHEALLVQQGDETNGEYLDGCAMADADDPLVMALARHAVSDAGDSAMEKANAMRQYVHRDMVNGGLSTAFATASETARTKKGDCSEHAVLLCAMLRSQGIPSRAATGLVYVEQFQGKKGIFGWHMWTQALIDGKWIDLDATLPVRYTAGHILTSTTSLHDGSINTELASAMMLIGNLEIEVVDVGYD